MSRAAPLPTVADIVDEAPIGGLQITVFALCIAVSILDGFDTQAIAFVAPAIARQWAISQWDFGIVFSATLFGTAIGSALFGILADRIGRRRLIITTTMLFGACSAGCALSTSYEALLIFRFLGGIGMGGVIPNMLALAAEYAPHRSRARIVTFTLWGFPFGAVIGGLAANPLIGAFGWPSVFWAGAILPILLGLVLIIFLPESLRYLALSGTRHAEISTLVRKIAPQHRDWARGPEAKDDGGAGRIGALLRPDLMIPTLLLSCVMFLSLFLTYLLINWIPTLLAQAGMSLGQAILGSVALNVGGIAGSYLMSRAIDGRGHAPLLLAMGYACGAAMIGIAGGLGGHGAILALSLLFLCGTFHIGSQLSTSAYATDIYPVFLRGTGLGVIQAVGRAGSLAGPVVGGALLSGGLAPDRLLQLAAVPALFSAALLLLLFLRLPRPASVIGKHARQNG